MLRAARLVNKEIWNSCIEIDDVLCTEKSPVRIGFNDWVDTGLVVDWRRRGFDGRAIQHRRGSVLGLHAESDCYSLFWALSVGAAVDNFEPNP